LTKRVSGLILPKQSISLTDNTDCTDKKSATTFLSNTEADSGLANYGLANYGLAIYGLANSDLPIMSKSFTAL